MKNIFIISIFTFVLIIKSFAQNDTTSLDFSLKNVDGNLVSLKDYSDAKGFIIIFTCNHCPFAKLYPKRLNKLKKKYSNKGFPLLAISSTDTILYAEDTYDNMVIKANKEKFNFPYLYDETQSVAKLYKAERTPQAFVLFKENKTWVIKYNGAIDDNGAEPKKVKVDYVSDAVDALLKNQKVLITETKSIGCKIMFRNQVKSSM
ncbi:MAG: thioredoxin family protein [Sphingobacteriales bacterium]|nr:thioredoxin family protein [Sphingobacteriales bacterium]